MLREVKRAVLREGWFHKIGGPRLLLLSYLLRVCWLCWITGTEQQLTPTNDILFWNQVIEGGSIFLHCALAFDSLTLRRAHFFCFRCVHFGRLLPLFVPTELRGINSASLDLFNQALFVIKRLRNKDFIASQNQDRDIGLILSPS